MPALLSTRTHIALVPARRRSSRCLDKNWRPFHEGRSLVDFALTRLPRSLFRTIMVSTDHPQYQPPKGCRLHRRGKHLATDDASIYDLLRQLIDSEGWSEEYIWLLNPTSPFRDAADFAAIERIIAEDAPSSIVSVSPIAPFVWKNDQPLFQPAPKRVNTQAARDRFSVENGLFYVFRADRFREEGHWYFDDTRLFFQDHPLKRLDIDTPGEFEFAARAASSEPRTFLRADLPSCEPRTSVRANVSRANDDAPEGGCSRAGETLELERLIAPPMGDHVKLLADHFARYARAIEVLRIGRNDRVLDASCGQGYGAWLISRHAGRVMGVDVNEEYLSLARRHFAHPAIEFASYDALHAGSEPFDKLACIETFEHLALGDQGAFLDRLLSRLRDGGDAYVTCPIGRDAPCSINPFHLSEPSIQSLHDRLVNRFERSVFDIVYRTDSYGRYAPYCAVTLIGHKGEPSPRHSEESP